MQWCDAVVGGDRCVCGGGGDGGEWCGRLPKDLSSGPGLRGRSGGNLPHPGRVSRAPNYWKPESKYIHLISFLNWSQCMVCKVLSYGFCSYSLLIYSDGPQICVLSPSLFSSLMHDLISTLNYHSIMCLKSAFYGYLFSRIFCITMNLYYNNLLVLSFTHTSLCLDSY